MKQAPPPRQLKSAPPEPHLALIGGEWLAVERCGNNNLLASGWTFNFEPLSSDDAGALGRRLLAVARLRRASHGWRLNERWLDDWFAITGFERNHAGEWTLQGKGLEELPMDQLKPERCRTLALYRRLKGLAEDVPVEAVAWFNDERGDDRWAMPVLLRSFQKSAKRAEKYMARVKGAWCHVAWDGQTDTLLVDDTSHTVEALGISSAVLRRKTLLSISKLDFKLGLEHGEDGQWFADREMVMGREFGAAGKQDSQCLCHTDRLLEDILQGKAVAWEKKLGEPPSSGELRSKAVAVAFVAELAEPFSWPTAAWFPVFLSKFEPIRAGRKKVGSHSERRKKQKAGAHHKTAEAAKAKPWHTEGFGVIYRRNSKEDVVDECPPNNEFRALCQFLQKRPGETEQFNEIESQIGPLIHQLDQSSGQGVAGSTSEKRRLRGMLQTETGKRLSNWGVLTVKKVGREKFLKLSPPKTAK